MSQQKITRRKFLIYSALGAAGTLLAACASPTAAPAANTEVPATAAPEATATSVAIKANEATSTPVAAASTKYKQSPMLDDLVKSGKLPPVEQRIPVDVAVTAPVEKIGKFGGTMHVSSKSDRSQVVL